MPHENQPQGLSSSQAVLLLKQYGPNEIVEGTKVTPLQILLRQVQKNYVVYMLIVAALVSFLVGKTFTAYTIVAVILSVIVVGFIQEYKAEKSISSLKSMIMPVSIVIRDGIKKEIPTRELVPGDILILGNGEKIPADCELLEDHGLRVNESALTGESKEISKYAKLPESSTLQTDDSNNLYMGTFIVNGRGTAKVVHTGMNTKFGKIAHLISSAEKDFPLQNKINEITKYMVIIAIVSSILTGLLMLVRTPQINPSTLVEILILMVALAVSAFPEGFPVVLITTLAVGAKRMSDQNAIVGRMSIIETLGETTVICSDKTGTITKGEMTVKFVFTGDELYQIDGSGFSGEGVIKKNEVPINISNIHKEQNLKLLIQAGILCNDSEIERTGDDNEYRSRGTPTEVAIKILGVKAGLFEENLGFTRREEIPFNSERKMMSVLSQNNGSFFVFAKGAPELLIPKCSKYIKNNQEIVFSQGDKNSFYGMQLEMSKSAYRTLAIAYKKVDSAGRDYKEEDFVFLGLVAMEDSPREEVAESIKTTQRAGIKVIMITGDSKDTAVSIAKQIGLPGKVIEGNEMDRLSDQELSVVIKDYSVFARVRPEHKIRIVKILKGLGEIVAMTGDGVNDAPALKEAHIGIAMGKNGTDVSRSAADLVLKDDNFATIVKAVAEGRTMFNNLRKFVTYQLACNFAELVVLFLGVLWAPLFGWGVPLLLSIQILFMNLVTDNIPAITLGLNPTSKDIMDESPRIGAKILNKVLVRLMIVSGILMAMVTIGAYAISFNLLDYGAAVSTTVALVALILIEIGLAFSYRSFRKMALNRSPFVNKYLAYAAMLSIVLTIAIIYTPLNIVFETVPIGYAGWMIAISLTLIGMVIQDVVKAVDLRNKDYVESTR